MEIGWYFCRDNQSVQLPAWHQVAPGCEINILAGGCMVAPTMSSRARSLRVVPMIHIIGTGHSTQIWSDAVRNGTSLDASAAVVSAFEAFLSEAAVALGAVAIAEEMSEEGVARKADGASVAKIVCERLGIRHAYCDPDTAARQRLSIASDDWAAREAFWANAIQQFAEPGDTIIFVCGAGHVDRFAALLAREGMPTRVHCRDWTLL